MKDVTSTSFGLIIAYLLPGVAGFYSLKYYLPDVNKVLGIFLTPQFNAGLFFMVIFASLIIGMIVTAFRGFIYESILCKSYKLKEENFKKIGADENKLNAFRAATDEHYRYHQFWGGISLVLPIFSFGFLFLNDNINSMSCLFCWSFCIVALLTEYILIKVSIGAYEKYIARSNSIIGG